MTSKIFIGEFRRLFINRSDTYAIQLSSGGYNRVEEPLTDQVLERHLRGEITVGVYQLDQENMVKFLVYDLDPEHLDAPKSTCERILEACLDKARIYSDAVLLEASRFPDSSYHIWIFFTVPSPAKVARWVGYRILEIASLDPRKVEIFPKQNQLTAELPYGNLIKLPLGFHKVAGKWSRFLDFHTFEPIGIPLSELLSSVVGISFSDADNEKMLGFGEKRDVQTKFELPKNFKPLSDQEEERAVQFLCRYWKSGWRNRLELSFLGWCIKKGISYECAYRILREVADRTSDEEKISRLNLVDYHYKNRLNVPLKGKSGLREIIEEMAK